ncbi:YbhB/YbcL family Raf kinase inhibitor-like protein [Thermocrinis minervae]|uniref:Phospholipid-binding protein, PBP family n=1 Tax=Thermocrinis minervae TaxID=381751 RepID=A0A1M6RPP6_9AQUI|nr:YbhB/YbcL family Raf kinase inhibitor-like protein [Thermocrinis minervae]SHK34452.1 phospholipid-binding protein, PBP family [Thermocrinis minervae]
MRPLVASMVFLGFLSFQSKGMELKSSAFKNGQEIPRKYTCDGVNISPELSWENPPSGAKSYVLIMEDPDAPYGTFTHWVVYDIPAHVRSLKEGFPKADQVDGIKQGINDFGYVGYGGPCPPKGHGYHRYIFKLYVLSVESLNLPPKATKKQVEESIRGKVLAEGRLVGKYRR